MQDVREGYVLHKDVPWKTIYIAYKLSANSRKHDYGLRSHE